MPISIPNGPQIYSRDELIAAGYGGYAGWSDPEAGMDFRASGGSNKWTGTTGPTSGTANTSGNFNYESEVQKAYGELGTYYDRILKEAQGDVDLAIARMLEDYETGNRRNIEDTTIQKETIGRNVIADAQSRGLYSRSNFDQSGGFGIPDQELARRTTEVDQNLARAGEDATLTKTRRETDLKTDLERKKFELEQQRRKEAAELASARESRAFSRFSAGLT